MNITLKIFNDINRGYRADILKNINQLFPFFMAVVTYCYYGKVRRTMRTAIASYLLSLKFKYLDLVSHLASECGYFHSV